MLLESKKLLTDLDEQLLKLRENWKRQPGIALVWVGDDPQTAAFVRVKQRKAKQLDCNFSLHHFTDIGERQLEAVISSLNKRKDIDGIVLQLPLPKSLDSEKMISHILPEKDIDGLQGDYPAPTPSGILALLDHNNVELSKTKNVILGDGKLVGRPLAEMFKKRGISFEQISKDAEKQSQKLLLADVIISATGKKGLINDKFVGSNSIVVDGSGIDVDFEGVKNKVKLLTPKTGAIGPLTVSFLFLNLLQNPK